MLAAIVIGGCSSTATAPVDQQEPVSEPPVAAAPVEEAEEPSDFADDGITPIDASGRPLSRSFYFGYDTAVLNPADLAALEMHAQILRRNADKSVVIEGHCDERGTREYNLALGERRAEVEVIPHLSRCSITTNRNGELWRRKTGRPRSY